MQAGRGGMDACMFAVCLFFNNSGVALFKNVLWSKKNWSSQIISFYACTKLPFRNILVIRKTFLVESLAVLVTYISFLLHQAEKHILMKWNFHCIISFSGYYVDTSGALNRSFSFLNYSNWMSYVALTGRKSNPEKTSNKISSIRDNGGYPEVVLLIVVFSKAAFTWANKTFFNCSNSRSVWSNLERICAGKGCFTCSRKRGLTVVF